MPGLGLGLGLIKNFPLGAFVNPKFPSAATYNSIIGDNDIYTVPAGRKALVSDILCTNSTAGSVTYFPEIKIAGTYYRLGQSKTEATLATGHNYGMNSNLTSMPIVLNAGETFSVNSVTTAGATYWLNVLELDVTDPLNRASLTAFTVGENTMFTVPAGNTISIASLSFGSLNNPPFEVDGFCYFNNSGGTRTMGGISIVPSAGAVSAANHFMGSNSVGNTLGISKYFCGNMNAGDFVSINTDATTAGQFAWFNYIQQP